jgi:myo-inositol-1(or 4)-monophosphatase
MSSGPNLDYALDVAIEAVKKAGALIRTSWQSSVSIRSKLGHDIVSEVDLAAEREIVKHIRTQFPSHDLRSEEITDYGEEITSTSHRFRWVIDPLDGTINYVSGLPLFSSSVAFQLDGRTVLGVIYDPIADQLFTSMRDRGSFLNKAALRVSRKSDIGQSVLSFMLTSHYDEEQTDRTLRYARKLATKCRGLRLYVSQAMELAYIAMGKLDGTFSVKSRGFSAAAGVLIVREAGGRVTDLAGVEFDNSSRSLLATNSLVHEDILNLFGEKRTRGGARRGTEYGRN